MANVGEEVLRHADDAARILALELTFTSLLKLLESKRPGLVGDLRGFIEGGFAKFKADSSPEAKIRKDVEELSLLLLHGADRNQADKRD